MSAAGTPKNHPPKTFNKPDRKPDEVGVTIDNVWRVVVDYR
jgi:hypothetical protein